MHLQCERWPATSDQCVLRGLSVPFEPCAVCTALGQQSCHLFAGGQWPVLRAHTVLTMAVVMLNQLSNQAQVIRMSAFSTDAWYVIHTSTYVPAHTHTFIHSHTHTHTHTHTYTPRTHTHVCVYVFGGVRLVLRYMWRSSSNLMHMFTGAKQETCLDFVLLCAAFPPAYAG